jgi:hypothetical protein
MFILRLFAFSSTKIQFETEGGNKAIAPIK